MIGWIILGATLALFVAFGIVLWLGRRLKYPPGLRLDRRLGELRVVVVIDESVKTPVGQDEELADAAARAIKCVIDAWKELGLPGDAFDALNRMCCLYLSDEIFNTPVRGGEAYLPWLPHQAAYLAQVPRATGSGPPLAVIRARHIVDTIDRGEPVIHECLHACSQEGGMGYRDHNNTKIWGDASSRAGQLFVSRCPKQ